MSKKLLVALANTVIAILAIALNKHLALEIPTEVQVALAAQAGAVAFWYLQKQGVIDSLQSE